MADKGSEHEESSESLSATGMFLRSFAPAPPEPVVSSEPIAPAVPVAAPQAGAGEFTRMFRPVLPPEPAYMAPQSPPQASPTSPDGDFTRAFVMPSSGTGQQPSPTQAAPAKAKGFSTPGVSDSASAEGSFTRMFRPEPQPVPQRPSEPYGREPASSPATYTAAPATLPELPFVPETRKQEIGPQSSGITEMFRALAPEGEKLPRESAYQPEPLPVPQPYTEPVRLTVPERSPQASPGGGVTELLSRLTAETPLMPSAPATTPFPRPVVQQEIPVSTPPASGPGEFTRIMQAAEIQAALAGPPHPPPAVASSAAAAAPPAFSMTPPPLPLPAVKVAPAAPLLPPIAAPALPKLQVTSPKLPTPPKSKMQEMIPLLLVANAFLMLILILLVALALHRK